MTGNVTVVENNAETKVKIGKVLKPGSMVKTQKQAQLTMVCKQGKPITISKEGNFPVNNWRDSCRADNNYSMTTKYFQFIWDQLYVRSDEYKKEHPGEDGSLTAAPTRGDEDLEIYVNEWMDTVNYVPGNFPLSIIIIMQRGYNTTFSIDYQEIERIYPGGTEFHSINTWLVGSKWGVRLFLNRFNHFKTTILFTMILNRISNP